MGGYSVCGQHSFLPMHECRGLQNEAKMICAVWYCLSIACLIQPHKVQSTLAHFTPLLSFE